MYLGFDIGSSGVKAIALDVEHGVLASASRPVALSSPQAGWAEADTEEWWTAVCELASELIALAGAPDGVACSGMVPAAVLLDEEGEPLRPAVLQNDARAVPQLAELQAALASAEILRRTGSELTQQSIGPLLLWLQEHEPSVLGSAASLCGSYDWIARRLGAAAHIERNWAIESGLFELQGGVASDVLRLSGAAHDWLAPVENPGTHVGSVSDLASAESGIPAGTPIAVGLADHVSSAYGAGVMEPGDALVKLGGAADVLVVTDRPILDRRLYLDAHPAGGGRWLPNGCMATSGSLTRWVRDLVGDPGIAALEQEAEEIGPGASGVLCLPYFLGEKSPLHDPRQRGVFAGLHLAHGRGHLYRAALESVAFGIRHHFDVFADLDISVNRVCVSNGGSGSVLWKQIIADVLDMPLEPVRGHPGAALGAAMAAAVATGGVKGWDAILELVQLDAAVTPSLDHRPIYDRRYELYREMEPTMRPLAHELAKEQT